jgi:hypothetical protein
MAGFCVSCGNPLADGARFCTKCGATQPGAPAGVPAAASAPPPSPAAPVSKGSNTVVKILVGILCFFVFLSLVVAGSCFYFIHRAKQRVHEISQSMGANAKPYTGRKQPCAMLTTGEASQALGQPVASVEQRGTTICEYTYGSGKHFDIAYSWQGGGVVMAITRGALKQVGGTQTFTPVEGVGDEAFLAPDNSSLLMRKGDVMVTVDLRASGISAEAAESMARTIADRL